VAQCVRAQPRVSVALPWRRREPVGGGVPREQDGRPCCRLAWRHHGCAAVRSAEPEGRVVVPAYGVCMGVARSSCRSVPVPGQEQDGAVWGASASW